MREVSEPGISDEAVVKLLMRSAGELVTDTNNRLSRAVLHTINAVGRLAKRRTDRGWAQVSVAYVCAGADVGAATARQALNLVADTLLCTRTAMGYLTVTAEARAACIRLVDQIGAPIPAMHRDDWTGREVTIETPKTRGKTHCPCGEHSNGDASPSLAYDLRSGLATCQKTLAVFKLIEKVWTEVRAPWSKGSDSRGLSDRRDNTYPPGGDGCSTAPRGCVVRCPTSTATWHSRDPWGHHLNGTLHSDGMRRSEACWDSPHNRKGLPNIMRWSDAHYGGQAEEDKARLCADCHEERPGRLVSLDRWTLDYDATYWKERADGTFYPKIKAWKPAGTQHVLFDLDGLDDADTDVDDAAVRRLIRALQGTGFKATTIVATSRTGLQVVAELPGWHPSPERLHHDVTMRRALISASALLLKALGRGGHADPSGWAPGRYCRRPGWRVKGGKVVRARLWWATRS